MAEYFFDLSRNDQREALEQVRSETGRPTHLLEKDIWVVWALRTLFESPLAGDLTFKGGTSLSKVYKIIDRFSEDVDLTYDIRKLISDLVGGDGDLPSSRSQADKWTKAVRKRLPDWIITSVKPTMEGALAQDRLHAKVEIAGKDNDKLLLHYPALVQGTGYMPPVVTLEFGGRATGEPHQMLPVTCDMDGHLPELSFPAASPLVMSVARTFWEKATAAHVYCAQGRIRSERGNGVTAEGAIGPPTVRDTDLRRHLHHRCVAAQVVDHDRRVRQRSARGCGVQPRYDGGLFPLGGHIAGLRVRPRDAAADRNPESRRENRGRHRSKPKS